MKIENLDELVIPKEDVYPLPPELAKRIGISEWDPLNNKATAENNEEKIEQETE